LAGKQLWGIPKPITIKEMAIKPLSLSFESIVRGVQGVQPEQALLTDFAQVRKVDSPEEEQTVVSTSPEQMLPEDTFVDATLDPLKNYRSLIS